LSSGRIRPILFHYPNPITQEKKTLLMDVRTRRQALLQLVGLVGILQDEGVQEAVAADLELGLVGRAAALDPGG
jgi:hypothetical protein